MGDIQPSRNFLMEIQGQPDFIYTQETVNYYSQLREGVLLVNSLNQQQQKLKQQILHQISGLQDLILDYEREINEAIDYLPAVTEMEKKHLNFAFHKIQHFEQQVQALLAQAW
jgi:hypothetical protein